MKCQRDPLLEPHPPRLETTGAAQPLPSGGAAIASHDETKCDSLAPEDPFEYVAAYHHLRAVLDTTVDGVVSIDQVGTIEYFNAAAERMFGYQAAEVLGQNVKLLMPDDHARQHDQYLARYVATGERRVIGIGRRVEARRKDGTLFPVDLALSEARHGKRRTFTGVLCDLTEIERAEAELEALNGRLVEMAHQAGKAEIASGILHNVGNVLNPISIAAWLIAETLEDSELPDVCRAVGLLEEHRHDLAEFFASDPRAVPLSEYLSEAVKRLADDRAMLLEEVAALTKNVEHVSTIIDAQQNCATQAGVTESVSLETAVEEALRISANSNSAKEVEIVRRFEAVPAIVVEKPKLMQILINLIRNAFQAVQQTSAERMRVTLVIASDGDYVAIEVIDNGIGIPKSNLTRIFSFGFTTKATGHGFGLHSSVLAAKSMGGSLTVESEGLGHGARFRLRLPLERQVKEV